MAVLGRGGARRKVVSSIHKLTGSQVAKFAALAALLAILADAAIGHGLTWGNDPYWTYWVTKTFLIATVIGLGTAWFGIGVGRGASCLLKLVRRRESTVSKAEARTS